jgi:hypothetical protein
VASPASRGWPVLVPLIFCERLNPLRLDHHRLPFALPALRQPGGQPLRKTLRSQTKTRLYPPITHRQRIVKLRRIRKIPHTKLVQPLDWTGPPLSAYHHIHLKFLRIHGHRIALVLESGGLFTLRLEGPPLFGANLATNSTRKGTCMHPRLASNLTLNLNWFVARASVPQPPFLDGPFQEIGTVGWLYRFKFLFHCICFFEDSAWQLQWKPG